jgi:integrase
MLHAASHIQDSRDFPFAIIPLTFVNQPHKTPAPNCGAEEEAAGEPSFEPAHTSTSHTFRSKPSTVTSRNDGVEKGAVNRELATLRRMLRLAHEWKEIQRVPRIRLLSGERVRDFVLSRKQEEIYLAACRQPLHDIAVLMLETGLRIGETLNLEWTDIILGPVNGARLVF